MGVSGFKGGGEPKRTTPPCVGSLKKMGAAEGQPCLRLG